MTRSQDVRLTLDHCMKCNICTTACPVATVAPERFPGPKYVGPQAQRFRDPRAPTVDRSVDYCSGCGVCDMVCPHGVKIMEINAKARAKLYETERIPLRNLLISRSEWLGKLAHPVAPLANWAMHFSPFRLAAEAVLGIDHRAPFPPIARQTFRDWYRGRRVMPGRPFSFDQPASPGPARPGDRGQVLYFHGCSTQYYEPRVGKAAVAVLERNGFEVVVPDQNCCGLPIMSQGDFTGARRYAYSNLRKLAPWVRRGYLIVGTSTSCTLTLKHDYRAILDIDDEDARLVAEHTYDICEFLRLLWERDELDTGFAPLEATVPYHAPCQLKAHGMGRPAFDLMSLIPGLTVVEMDADCCGIAGTYGYKHEKYDIAMAVGEPLFRQILETGGPVAVCDSETCRWQISHGTGRPSVHPVEVLALAYGIAVDDSPARLLCASR
ncbi:MAG: anaerobic glycerol-3-phosphate dehydrogenase subunit C [Chloroflexi bacterium]|nr:anaerobic glycerol-3-phosphate dehydrogenase subunit C [Chloroflexota bacterium]